MVQVGVLRFGDFTTKSGRKTPYFVNTGLYRTGGQMRRLAQFYADAIEASGVEFDVLFGPAYKGIPLSVATAMMLEQRGRDVSFTFNRKEAKAHGEGGSLVGEKLQDGTRVLIIEDVTTAGTSLRETIPLLQQAGAIKLAGLIVSVDRQERGLTDNNALAQVEEDYNMPAFSIVKVDEVIEFLSGRSINGQLVLSKERADAMRSYRETYGGKERLS